MYFGSGVTSIGIGRPSSVRSQLSSATWFASDKERVAERFFCLGDLRVPWAKRLNQGQHELATFVGLGRSPQMLEGDIHRIARFASPKQECRIRLGSVDILRIGVKRRLQNI